MSTQDSGSSQIPTLRSVAASEASESSAGEIVVRVSNEDDLQVLSTLDPERVSWVEVPMDLANRSELNAFSVDVLLSDPSAEAGRLYRLAGQREPNLPRLSIPTKAGFGDAVSVAMALHFPIRLIPVQPQPDEIEELERVLERYLHDANAQRPVEPFHSALATLLHGDGSSLWDAVEYNPAWFHREPPYSSLEEPDFVSQKLESLVTDGAECASCSLQPWCAGWFKWPDPAYDCEGVRRLFGTVEKAAVELRTDFDESLQVSP